LCSSLLDAHPTSAPYLYTLSLHDALPISLNLDDVIDGMEEFTSLMDIYQIFSADSYIKQFTDYIYECAEEILTSIELIAGSKMKDIGPHVIRIKDLESKCDDVYHASLKELFQTG